MPAWVLASVLGVLASTCTKRIPEPANVAPGTPHVTWVLMYGDRDNADQEFACQSQPKSDCLLPASQLDAQVFSDIHFYYHGAGSETRYEGTTTIGYLRGSPASQSSRTDVTVRKNESITNQSVIGIVTTTPGTYTVTSSVTATVRDTGKTHTIQETIQVTVK